MPSAPPFAARASQLIRPSHRHRGERRDLFISGAPEIHNGEVVGISCIARDITERIQTEKALCLSEARYRELIHALPAAVYTTDRQGRITLYNQAAITLWGREPEVGKDLWCGSWKIYRPDGDSPSIG